MNAKQTLATFIGITAIALTAGCIPSLFPIYNEQDLVQRNEILGRWVSDAQSQSWTFSQSGGNAYELVFVDNTGRDATFVAHLTEIDDVLFMDLYPQRSGRTKPGFYDLHLVATHTFFRVELADNALSLSFIDPQWLKQHFNEHPEVALHVRDKNSVLLTADTDTLRGFVEELLETEGAFTTPFELARAKGKLGT
jgi:hypothetical protein